MVKNKKNLSHLIGSILTKKVESLTDGLTPEERQQYVNSPEFVEMQNEVFSKLITILKYTIEGGYPHSMDELAEEILELLGEDDD